MKRGDTKKGTGLFSMTRSLSGYLKSGAASMASTVRSASASIAASITDDRPTGDQAHWAGFDKLEHVDGAIHNLLLLAYRSGFEVWDVEEVDDVHQLASRRDGPASFLQILKSPVASEKCKDKFADCRPLLVVSGYDSCAVGVNNQDMGVGNFLEHGLETSVQFYSLRIHSYVHAVKFRAPVYSIKCGPRVVAICQASQIHCFDAGTLERYYTLLTYPIVSGLPGFGCVGYGPLAIGTRWLAYSGHRVIVDWSGRVIPQLPDSAISSPVNGNLVAHYAKESGKQLASGLATIGELGYKKLSKYCSELLSDANYFRQGSRNSGTNGSSINGLVDKENAGMVIVRDIVSRSVVVQFRAHTSPISALCFDPSETLLVTASVCGHNINVFHIKNSPCGCFSMSDGSGGSYAHLYKLQRGITNAVIQDISFSFDSRYITISSSRGTSHIFALSTDRGMTITHPYNIKATSNGFYVTPRSCTQHSCGTSSQLTRNIFHQPTSPITLSAITRIRSGGNGWKATLNGTASAAGMVNFQCGAISSTFHTCKGINAYTGVDSMGTDYHMLLFSPAGYLTQYVLRHSSSDDNLGNILGYDSFPSEDGETNIVAEALQKWDICHKRTRMVNEGIVNVNNENCVRTNLKFIENISRRGVSEPSARDNKNDHMKITSEEIHRMYISEMELHTHPARVPLWDKPEINFYVMMDEDCGHVNDEILMEEISTRPILARSKDMFPSSNYLQLPSFQQSRTSSRSDDGKIMPRSSSSIVPLRGIPAFPELSSGDIGSECDSHPAASQDRVGEVNRLGGLNVVPLVPVHKVMVSETRPCLEGGHDIGSPRMKNLFLDGDNDID